MNMFYEPWLQFKYPIVRQLAFAIASPNILQSIPDALELQFSFELHHNHFWQDQFLKYETRLLQLDQNPAELHTFLKALKSTRLGLRFEHLIWFWLQDDHFHDFQLIGHSIQVIEAKHTVGELDFLIFNRATQTIEHWEVALKFYLAETELLLKDWYGLNRSDTLWRKLNHFTQKQFQFKHIAEHPIQKRFAVLKGQLYLPLPPEKAHNTTQDIPAWVNPKRRIGQWGNQCLQGYYRLERQEWICPHLEQSSANASWWSNGLYHNFLNQQDYMFRQAVIPHSCVRVM